MTESGFLETNGARLSYEVDGAGEPVVMVHAGIADLRMWEAQARALADAYRVIRYDARGYGRTETDAVAFSNRDDLAAVLDRLGESSAHIVGLSRGAMIALDFTVERPERVRSLVFAAGGVAGYDAPEEADAAVFEEAERLYEAKAWEALADWETRYWVDGPGQPPDRVDPDVRATVHDWILSNYRAEKEEAVPQPLDPPANARLDALTMPVLVIFGSLDEAETRAHCRHLAASVPGARLEVIEGAAHMVNLEQPERFNRLLREFLDGVRAAASA